MATDENTLLLPKNSAEDNGPGQPQTYVVSNAVDEGDTSRARDIEEVASEPTVALAPIVRRESFLYLGLHGLCTKMFMSALNRRLHCLRLPFLANDTS